MSTTIPPLDGMEKYRHANFDQIYSETMLQMDEMIKAAGNELGQTLGRWLDVCSGTIRSQAKELSILRKMERDARFDMLTAENFDKYMKEMDTFREELKQIHDAITESKAQEVKQ